VDSQPLLRLALATPLAVERVVVRVQANPKLHGLAAYNKIKPERNLPLQLNVKKGGYVLE